MAKTPTAWSKVTRLATHWIRRVLYFAAFNSQFPFNSYLPFNLGVDEKPTAWSKTTKTLTKWSQS